MTQRLTDQTVRKLPAPKRGNRITYDDAVKGFGCRVTAAEARAFILNYRRRSDGVERRYTIGAFPDWSVAAAREEAKRLKRHVDGGGDPVGEHREARAAPTVNDLLDRFEAEHLPRLRASTAADYRSMMRTHVRPRLGRHKVAALRFADIDSLHRHLTQHSGAHRANRTVALISKACSLAVKWQWRTDNPCRGVERNQEHKRKRYLTPDELARLSKALAAHDDRDAADAIRLLLLTGARRGEVLSARWADFDLSAGTWTKPGATTKQKTEHVVPLSAPARQLLAAREHSGDFVFPGVRGGHRFGLKSNWRRILQTAKISGLRIHDLRHSFASQLASSGASLPLIGSLLGHANPVTTHRYAHLFDDPQRAAVEKVGAIIAGKKSAEVVKLTGRRR
jgi:integrase